MKAAPGAWMAFYVGDYAKSTLKLTTRQHGAYLLLILACWQDGGSVDGDDETLASITKLPMEDWLKDRPKLASYFEITPQRWTHLRVVDELAEAARIVQQRSSAGKRGASRRWQAHAEGMAGSVADAWQDDPPSQSHARSPSPSLNPCRAEPTFADAPGARATTAKPIPSDWKPGEADLLALREERPDVTGELYERRMRDFGDWCRAKAVTSHDIASTWRSFMRRTDAAKEGPGRGGGGRPPAGHGGVPSSSVRMSGPDGIWKMRLTGYRPGDPWKYEGDPPGGPGCKVPADLIPHWQAYVRELAEAA